MRMSLHPQPLRPALKAVALSTTTPHVALPRGRSLIQSANCDGAPGQRARTSSGQADLGRVASTLLDVLSLGGIWIRTHSVKSVYLL